jgi:SAM-dependent methyltransferase
MEEHMTKSDQELCDLRWEAIKTTTDVERGRVEFTAAAIPSNCGPILDVGCGDGRLTRELHRKGYRVTGVDFSKVALSRIPVAGIQASCDAIPVDDLSYDLVLSTEMLEHLDQEMYERTIPEFCRIAKRFILITVPNRERLAEQMAVCACGHKFHIWGHKRSYRSTSLKRLFPGFRLVRLEEFGPQIHPYRRILLLLKQRLCQSWGWDEATLCAHCGGSSSAAPRLPLAAKICDYVNTKLKVLPRLATHRAWLLAAYRRQETELSSF